MPIDLPTTDDPARLICGDAVEVLAELPAGCVDAVVTDPPYGLAFMGKEWDSFGGRSNGNAEGDRAAADRGPGRGAQPFGYSGSAVGDRGQLARFAEFSAAWSAAALRVLKPGGYMLAMGGTRTFHRLMCAVEDSGLEVRDTLAWLYGSGFPKGAACLKPAWEPIVLARKPGPKVLPLGIDAARIEPTGESRERNGEPSQDCRYTHNGGTNFAAAPGVRGGDPAGRWPANVAHDGSAEVLEAFAAFGQSTSNGGGGVKTGIGLPGESRNGHEYPGQVGLGDTGTAARFFYTAKASKAERERGNHHPTVKPLALMRWLCRLVAAPGDLVLDPFVGSGTTARAAIAERMRVIGIDRDAGYLEVARRRLAEPLGVGGLFDTGTGAPAVLDLYGEPCR